MDKEAFRRGFLSVSPVMAGLVPFALLAGATPVEAGFSTLTAMALSVFVFAGASQLAMVQLATEDTAAVVIVLTALVINLRFAMYSASLSQYLPGMRGASRWLVPYLMTDQAFAISVAHYKPEHQLRYRVSYYMGIAVPTWLLWQTGTLTGALLGARIPPSWSLDFAIPLVFLSMIIPVIRSRAMFVAGLSSAVVSTLLYSYSTGLAILAGAFAGIVGGYLWARWWPEVSA